MDKKLPAGRIGRMARLAALGLRTGAGMVMGRGDEVAAAEVADVLGHLRGLAAKVGQMASYVDGIVPESKRDAFETSLKVLRSQAPRSSPAAIRALVEEELGAPIGRLFATWDDVPIASASIGQVHRATLGEPLSGLDEGVAVAVKVQHPGIRKAVESDLASASILESIGSLVGGSRFDTKGNFETLKARFREELDYALEAERLEAFQTIHVGDPTIQIPRLVRERSSASVLTTELVSGVGLDEAIAAPEDARRAWAETLWRYVFKGNLVGGMFNADPHPGNYLFQPDGRIAFVDYGCIQIIPPERRPLANALHQAALARDEEAFATYVRLLLDAKPGELERLAIAYSRRCFEPLFASPFRVTRPYAASLFEALKAHALAARKLPDAEIFQMPAYMLFMNRLQFGFYSVLARLDVEVDYAAVERAFAPDAVNDQ